MNVYIFYLFVYFYFYFNLFAAGTVGRADYLTIHVDTEWGNVDSLVTMWDV